jgi:hypothetical protein
MRNEGLDEMGKYILEILVIIQFNDSCLLSKMLNIRICKSIILPVVLCGGETWSHTFGKEYKL